MISKLVSCFVAGALGATVAVTSPALARGGGGMGGACISAPWAAACASAGAGSRVRILRMQDSRLGFRGSVSETIGFPP
jgi:hypothetical protein